MIWKILRSLPPKHPATPRSRWRPVVEPLEDRITPVVTTGTIAGQVWHDLNGDGTRDASEPFLNGWTVQLIDATGNVVDIRVSQPDNIDGVAGNEEGAYQFTGLNPGPYVVRQVVQLGWEQVFPTFLTALTTHNGTFGDWDYSDVDGNGIPGPANWAGIAPDTSGFFQSPIDLTGPTVDLSQILRTDYEPTVPEKIFNNGHSIEAEFPHTSHNTVTLDGEVFELLQFHFHAESEHTVNGLQSDMELHLVHKHPKGGLTVLGLLLKADAAQDNAVLKPVFDQFVNLPDKGNEVTAGLAAFDAGALLPANMQGWFYQGSLTTPPGNEGVNWFVFQTPLSISAAQLAAYRNAANRTGEAGATGADAAHDFYPGFRPTQSTNGRQLNQLNHEISLGANLTIIANFGNAMPGTIQGQVWHDLNGDGIRDANEPFINGWPIQLIDKSGAVVATQVTQPQNIDGVTGNEEGAYQFTGLKPGPYVVRQAAPMGSEQFFPTFLTALTTNGTTSGDWDHSDIDFNGVPGPADWHTIAPATDGHFQSPIDLTGPTVDLSQYLHTDYEPTVPERIFNNGHSIEAEYPGAGRNVLTLDGEEFELLQFHFHAESEHTVNGLQSDMELHLVHRHANGGLTVLGLFLEADAAQDNAVLKPIFDQFVNLPDKDDEVDTGLAAFDAAALLPGNMQGWFYQGSLTTPPGNEGVNWFVFQTPLSISAAQLAAYRNAANKVGEAGATGADAAHDFYPGFRPVQGRNGRQLNQLNHEVSLLSNTTVGADFGIKPPPVSLMAVTGTSAPASTPSRAALIQHQNAERRKYHAFARALRAQFSRGGVFVHGVVERFLHDLLLHLREHWRQERRTGSIKDFGFPG